MNINDWKTPEELAKEWDLTPRRVQIMCKEGRLEGAVKKGHQWMIPASVERPEKLRSGPKSKSNIAGENE